MLNSIWFNRILDNEGHYIITKSNSLVNLHDSAPIFQANMHQNAGAESCKFTRLLDLASIFLNKMDFSVLVTQNLPEKR